MSSKKKRSNKRSKLEPECALCHAQEELEEAKDDVLVCTDAVACWARYKAIKTVVAFADRGH